MSIQPLTDEELCFDDEESQALHQLKLSYQALRIAYEAQRVELHALREAIAARDAPPSIDHLTLHLQTCRDPDCTGCKRCVHCGTLTLALGFEDHLCFNCRHPPSD